MISKSYYWQTKCTDPYTEVAKSSNSHQYRPCEKKKNDKSRVDKGQLNRHSKIGGNDISSFILRKF